MTTNYAKRWAGFRESWLTPVPGGGRDFADDFGAPEARQFRYALLWSFYANVAYTDRAGWAGQAAGHFRERMGLYRHVRNLFNPAYRLVEFHAGKIAGGPLDPDAGDGEDVQSALPIVLGDTGTEALRPGIAKLWADSRWGVQTDLLGRFGAAVGDVAIEIEDRPEVGKVRLKVHHPGVFADIRRDWRTGEVTSYVREEWRYDPGDTTTPPGDGVGPRRARYREEATLDGGKVRYRTFKDGQPFGWDGMQAEWDAPYPFLPVVFVQHESYGGDFGLCAYHGGLSRFAEVDDQASGLSDQARKVIRAPMLLAGVAAPAPSKLVLPFTRRRDGECDPADVNYPYGRGQADREESPYLYTNNEKATAQDLAGKLDVPGMVEYIDRLMKDIEANYPELSADMSTSTGDASGRALRAARDWVSGKMLARRAPYDEAIVEAHRKAIAVAIVRAYPGYDGLPPEWSDPALDHRIGHRPVFALDPMDEMEAEGLALANAKMAVDVGVPLEEALVRYLAFKPELAKEIAAAKAKADEEQAKQVMEQMQAAGKARPPGAPSGTVAVPPPPGVKAGEKV